MREGPLDILDRNRGTFLKSIDDSIGKLDAGADFFLSAVSAERHGYVLSHDDNALIKMFYSIIKFEEAGFSGQEVYENSIDSSRIQGIQPGQSLAGYIPELSQGQVGDQYQNHNPFDYRFNPMYREAGGYSNKVNSVANFYLAPEVGADSPSLIDANKERAIEDEYRSDENYAFLFNHHHYGDLNYSNHDEYEQHFDNWRQDKVNEELALKEQGFSDMEIEHQLRQIHMQEAKDRWMSDDLDESGIPHRLGLFDYLFGLEWKTPEQRQEIYEHLSQWGLGDRFRRSIGSDNHTDVGRLTRNLQQRFAGMHDHWTRSPKHALQPIPFIPRPIGKPKIRPEMNLGAMNSLEGGLDKALDWHRSMRMDTDIYGPLSKSDKVWIDEDGKLQLGTRGALREKGLRRGELLRLLNVNPATGELYQNGNHPDYENWDRNESPFSQEDVGKVYQFLEDINTSDDYGVMGKNLGMWHYGHRIDPDHYPEDITNGEDTTLASHWNKMWKGGGFGKHPNELMNLLHAMSPLYGPDKMSIDGSEGHREQEEAADDYFQDLEEQSEIPPHQRPTLSAQRAVRSLLFDKNELTSTIGIRHMKDSEGNKINNGMLNALGPFGHPEKELEETEYKTAKGEDRKKVQVTRGIGTDAESVHNPHNQFTTSKFGTRRTNWTRHWASNNPITDARHAKEMREKYGTPEWQVSKNKLSGLYSGAVAGHNPFMGTKEGALSSERAKRKLSHLWHRTGTRRHKNAAPFTRDNGIRGLGSQIGSKPTAHDLDAIDALTREREVGFGTDIGPAGMFDEAGRPMRWNPETGQPQVPLRTTSETSVVEAEEEMNRLVEEIRRTEDKVKEEGITDKHREHLTHRLHELEDELMALDEEAAGVAGAEGAQIVDPTTLNDGAEEEEEASDEAAIAQMARMLQQKLNNENPELWNNLLGEHLPPETLDANIRQFLNLDNTYLQQAPHEMHGLTKRATGYHEQEVPVEREASAVKQSVHNSENKVGANSSPEEVADMLNLDYGNERHKATVDSLLDKVRKRIFDTGDTSLEFPVMTVEQMLSSTDHFGNLGSGLSDTINRIHDKKTYNKHKGTVNVINRVRRLLSSREGKARTVKVGTEEKKGELGLDYHIAHNPDPDSELSVNPTTTGGSQGSTAKNTARRYRALQDLNSVLISDPTIEPDALESVMGGMFGMGDVPIDANGHIVGSYYNSSGYNFEMGDQPHDDGLRRHMHPTFTWHINPQTHEVEYSHDAGGVPYNITRPLSGTIEAAFPHLSHLIDHPEVIDALSVLGRQPPQFQVSERARVHRPNRDSTSVTKSKIGLADLTNPDIIRKELGEKIPLLQPMHRIFKLEDLEHLRGFTGDWIVSVMPEGERGFVIKEDDKVTSPSFKLSDEDKDNFKKVADKDYHIDVIKTEEGYYIFDVIKYDDEEVHDTLLDARIKILRGGMEGVENIHVPSASDTRLTDDGGLESTVEDLKKDNDRLLLRDAKSTYMVGELRQPKWVLLSEGKDVVLIVLERRGSGPYTYRLGTGPITQDDSLGARAVELNDETYMDVGAAFDSDEKFNEGDHVKVNVDNVGVSEFSEGHKLYTVSGSEIQGEAEGEGLVSQETLGLLAKSAPEQWLCEINSVPSGIRVVMPQGDVVYKATESAGTWTLHSPLANNSYLIRLSESQRPYWGPVAGTMLKAGLEIAEKEEVHDDGYEPGPSKPFIKPKKIKDTDWWDEEEDKKKVLVKGLQLVEKLLKSGVGSVGQSSTGAMGLGIDYATPIESPTGPTNLHDSKTMPDYDNKKRPGEDYSIEPETEDSEPAKNIVIPVKEGKLELTNDTAVLRT